MQITKLPERIYDYLTQANQPEKGYTLALFRLVFVLQCFLMLYHTHVYKPLLFDSVAGFSKNVFPFNTLLGLWFVSLMLLLVGYYSRYAAVANYVCIILITDLYARAGVGSYYDDMLKMGSILLFLLPVNSRFSLDSILNPTIRNTCVRVHYYAAWILLFGLMYFMSGISKILSPIWQKGLGLWTPLSMPYWRWNGWMDGIQDQYYLMLALNYLVIIWEVVFVFLIFHKKWRPFIVITGIVFHFNIALFFYFPQTAICAAWCYVLFIPESFWSHLYQKLSTRLKYSIYVPGNPDSIRYFRIIKAIDFRNKFNPAYDAFEADIILNSKHAVGTAFSKYIFFYPLKWVYSNSSPFDVSPSNISNESSTHIINHKAIANITIFIVVMQLIYMLGYSYSKLTYKKADLSKQAPNSNKERGLKLQPFSIMRTFFGINSKAVFTDKAMLANRNCYAISYKDNKGVHWLPIVNTNGFITTDLNKQGAWWKIHHFAMSDAKNGLNPDLVIRNIMYLSSKQGIDYKNTRFRILYRSYPAPHQYERGFYKKMYTKPWLTAGIVVPTGAIPRLIHAKPFKPL